LLKGEKDMSKANRFLKLLIILLVITLATPFAWSGRVRALSTVLAISPASSTALTCDDTIIKVRVQDVVNLYAYDISVSWTSSIPGAIEVVDVSNSGFLDFGTQYIKSINNTTGRLRYVMSQKSPSTAKSGSGDLISIHVHALIPGATVNMTIVTTGTLPTKLSAIGGVPITFTTSNGSLTTSDVCPPAELSISPTPVTACTNADLTLKVRVRYVVNLYGYDIDLSFNPGSIQIISVTNGGFLEEGLAAPTNGYNNSTGMIQFGNAQMDPALPKTGTGDLISITLRATVPNQTVYLNIDEVNSYLVDNDIMPIEFSASGAVITTSTCEPTSVDLLSFTAQRTKKAITLNWETANETNRLGFNLYRATSADGDRTRLNALLIPPLVPPGSQKGAEYSYTDTDLKPNTTYHYWLEELDRFGAASLTGPVSVKLVPGKRK
jgi:hypothetical protein